MNRLAQFIFMVLVCSGYCTAVAGVLPATKRITPQNGLADTRVKFIFQDRKGFIWLNTVNGLQRYDGSQFFTLTYNPNQPQQSLPSAIMNFGIIEDGEKHIWAATEHEGIVRYIPQTGEIDVFNKDVKDPRELRTHTVLQTKAGDIFTTTPIGLLRLNNDRFVSVIGSGSSKYPLPCFRSLMEDEHGNLWISSCNGFVMVDSSGEFHGMFANGSNSVLLQRHWDVSSSTIDRNQCIWFGSWSMREDGVRSLYKFDTQKNLLDSTVLPKSKTSDDYYSIPSSITQDKIGNIWVATLGGRILVYDSCMRLVYDFEAITCNGVNYALESISTLFCDREGQIWIATQHGLFICRPQDAVYSLNLELSNIRFNFQHGATKLFVSDLGKTYVNSISNGIYKWDISARTLKLLPLNLKGGKWANHLNILYSDGGKVYINPWFSDAILAYDESESTLNTVVPAGLLQHYDILMLRAGNNLLLSGKNGIYIFTDGNPVPDSITWPGATPILTDWTVLNKSIVIAIDAASKVYKIDCAQLSVQQLFNMKLRGEWFSIEAVDAGMLVGTHYEGLKFVDYDGSIRFSFSTNDGLLSNSIDQLYADSSGIVWVKTKAGFNYWNPMQPQQVYTRKLLDKRYHDFYDGFPDRRNGFVFLNRKHIEYFASLNFAQLDTVPFVFTAIRAGNEVKMPGEAESISEISWQNNPLSFAFAALDFTQNSSILYRYKLLPSDKEWTHTGSNGQVVFHHLPAGNYQFQVQYRMLNGNWQNNTLTYSFKITKPFWQKWWVYALLLAVLLIPWIYYRKRESLAKERLQNLRWQLSRDLHDDIGSTLSSIGVYAAVLDNRVQDEKGKALVQEIGNRSKELIRNMSDIVWAIQPGEHESENLLQRFRQYATPLLESEGMELRLRDNGFSHWKQLSMLQRRNIFLVLKEALTNTLRYAGARSVTIRSSYVRGQFELIFEDDGKGFDPNAPGRKNGLLNMEYRIGELNGTFLLHTAPGAGCRIHIKVPVPA